MPTYTRGGISRICTDEVYQRELKPLGYILIEENPTKPIIEEVAQVEEVAETPAKVEEVAEKPRRTRKK